MGNEKMSLTEEIDVEEEEYLEDENLNDEESEESFDVTYPGVEGYDEVGRPIIKSPIKAIRVFCLQCSGDNRADVKNCSTKMCPLYYFRTGKNPYRTRNMTEEQRLAAGERMKKARKNKGMMG